MFGCCCHSATFEIEWGKSFVNVSAVWTLLSEILSFYFLVGLMADAGCVRGWHNGIRRECSLLDWWVVTHAGRTFEWRETRPRQSRSTRRPWHWARARTALTTGEEQEGPHNRLPRGIHRGYSGWQLGRPRLERQATRPWPCLLILGLSSSCTSAICSLPEHSIALPAKVELEDFVIMYWCITGGIIRYRAAVALVRLKCSVK